MSKIDNYNMELEEEFRDQLNELGSETLQDALNSGWGVYDGELVRQKDLSDKAYEQAQKDWEKEKREILDGLNESIDDVDNRFEGEPWAETVCEKINQAIEFLEKARF